MQQTQVDISHLTTLLSNSGASVVGFASIDALSEDVRQGFPNAVSIGVVLNRKVVAGIAQGPTSAYQAEYTRVNALLDRLARGAADFLQAEGFQARPLRASADWCRDTLSAGFQNKTAATLAGVGWIGKSALLVTPVFGSAVRWNTVLTDAPLPVRKPITGSQCGDCDACVKACPGKACSGRNWEQSMARDAFWNAEACMAGIERIAAENHVDQMICGICIAACPYTRRYVTGSWD